MEEVGKEKKDYTFWIVLILVYLFLTSLLRLKSVLSGWILFIQAGSIYPNNFLWTIDLILVLIIAIFLAVSGFMVIKRKKKAIIFSLTAIIVLVIANFTSHFIYASLDIGYYQPFWMTLIFNIIHLTAIAYLSFSKELRGFLNG